MKIKKFCISSLIFLCFGISAIYSQNTPEVNVQIPSKVQSNTFLSSATTIKSDADKYADLLAFKDVNFKDSFFNANFSSDYLQLGGAKKFGKYYLSGYYTGNLWEGASGSKVDNKSTLKGVFNNLAVMSFANNKNDIANGNVHSFGVLFGFKNMGVMANSLLVFNSNKKENESVNDKEAGVGGLETLKDLNNYYSANLSWSGMFNINAKINLKPLASFGFVYNDNYFLEGTQKIQATTTNVIHESEKTEDLRKSNTTLLATTGLEAEFGKHTNFIQKASISYVFGIPIYEKNRSVTTTTFTDTNNPGRNSVSATQESIEGLLNIQQILGLGYSFNYKPFLKFTVGGRAELGILMNYLNPGKKIVAVASKDGSLTNRYFYDAELNEIPEIEKTSEYSKKNLIKNRIFATSFTPILALGIGYDVKPTFTINVGYLAELPEFSVINQNCKINSLLLDSNNRQFENNQNVKRVLYEAGKMKNTLSLGFTWRMAQYGALDSSISFSNKPSVESLLQAQWNIGLSLCK